MRARRYLKGVVVMFVTAAVTLASYFHGHSVWHWARHHLDKWDAWVAIGTLSLAAATAYLGRQARKEASAVRDEQSSLAKSVRLQEQQAAVGIRPLVFPDVSAEKWVTDPERAFWLPLTNGGAGVALNVRGTVESSARSDGSEREESEILQTTIPVGGTTWARLASAVQLWSGATGVLRYVGLDGKAWQTRFRIDQPEGTEYHAARVEDIFQIGVEKSVLGFRDYGAEFEQVSA